MMESCLGRPNMDMELDDESNEPKNEWSDCDNEDGDEDDMDEWGAPPPDVIRGGGSEKKEQSSTTDAPFDPMSMFTPQPVLNLADKPQLPMLSEEELPPGTNVWVVDSEDVALLLKGNWEAIMNEVCCGQRKGTVVRHSGAMTLVNFNSLLHDVSVVQLTLPRGCLSIVEIQPYENRIDAGDTGQGFGVGTLGPRGRGRPGNAKGTVARPLTQFYDVASCSAIRFDTTKEGVELIQDEKFEEAMQHFHQKLSTSTGSAESKEYHVARSVAGVFAEQLAEALTDALRAIEISPSWPPGYLAAARCYATLGKLSQSAQMLNQAQLLLPHDADIPELQKLSDSLRFYQQQLESTHMYLRINGWYRKLLHSRRGFSVGDVVLEDRVVAGVSSVFNTEPCCWHCLGALSQCTTPPVESPLDRTVLFCGEDCLNAALASYHTLEATTASLSFRSATMLIHNKASASLMILPLEHAKLAVRLFYTVVALTGEAASRESLHAHLMNSTFFPSPKMSFDSKQTADLATLYNVLVGSFSEEKKELFTLQLFTDLYAYCAWYAIPVTIQGVTAFVIPAFGGCVQRTEKYFNCEVVASPGSIQLIATAPIDAKDCLSIAKPSMQ